MSHHSLGDTEWRKASIRAGNFYQIIRHHIQIDKKSSLNVRTGFADMNSAVVKH